MSILRLRDDYDWDGRAISEITDPTALPAPIAADPADFMALSSAYKQLDAPFGSFGLSAKGRELWALVAAVFAIGAGLLGGLRALSPRVSGGIFSILAVLLGVIAIVVAFIALLV